MGQRLTTVLESINSDSMDEAFELFINEVGPKSHEPSVHKMTKIIKKRRYAGIYYEGEDNVLPGFRLIEPYCFGKGYKIGRKIINKDQFYLRAYVIKESKKDTNKQLHKINRKSVSKSQKVPYWRLFRWDKVKLLEELRFVIPRAQEGYSPDDKMIGKIITSANF